MTLLALKLVTAHFLTSFLICRNSWLRTQASKTWQGRLSGNLKNTAVFLILSVLLIVPSARPLDRLGMFLAIVILSLIRLGLEVILGVVASKSWYGFTLLHILHISAVVGLLAAVGSFPDLADQLASMWVSPRTYLLISAYLISAGFGSLVVPLVTAPLRPSDPDHRSTGIENAGKYVGILERLLITTLIIFWPRLDASAIGLVFSAKSIARFPEFKKQHFAEYYLVGTLTSFMVAIAAGLIVRFFSI